MSKTLSRMAGLAAAMAAAMALPAVAEQNTATQTAAAPAAGGEDAQIVVRDADTGKLRAATAEEHEQLRRSREGASREARGAAAATLAPRSHHSGARGTRLHDGLLHHSVLVRNADGTSSMMCVDSSGVTHALHTDGPEQKTAAAIPHVATKLETE